MQLHLTPQANNKEGYLYDGVNYHDFWNSSIRAKMDELEKTIIKELLPLSGRRIIDLGCGFGRLNSAYADRFDEVVCFDGSMSLLLEAKKIVKGQTTFIAGDIKYLPFREMTFDTVLMIRVFHHLLDSPKTIHDLNRIISPEGILIFNYNNKTNPMRILRRVIRKTSDNPFSHTPSGKYTRVISHHPDEVQALLEKERFEVLRYLGCGVFNKLSEKSKFFEKLAWVEKYWTSFLGKTKLAPWIFCSACTHKNAAAGPYKVGFDYLICPICSGELNSSPDSFQCLNCEKIYPLLDGIWDFRV